MHGVYYVCGVPGKVYTMSVICAVHLQCQCNNLKIQEKNMLSVIQQTMGMHMEYLSPKIGKAMPRNFMKLHGKGCQILQ